MSHSKVTLPPYPVQIGSVKHCSPEKHLQEYVQCANYAKVKKMLKKGTFPDSPNSLGQTPLFVAALLGLRKIAELLLNSGSNPNHRSLDWSTPVHAAAFSCDLWIMSRLIDAGGDLRLHDQKSKTPHDWALMAGTDESPKMIDFIGRCAVRMQALIHLYPLKPTKIDSSLDLINDSPLIDMFLPRTANRLHSKPNKYENLSVKKACCIGYGQFCVRDNGQAGFLLTLPFIEEKSLVREEGKPTFSFAAGPYMTMTNLLWGSTEVTVKGLSDMADNKCFADLLIAEEENMRHLQHPLILQLLALSTSPSLERKQLVFERVTIGSFYNILHERRFEYPVLHHGTIVHILLQMTEALGFLHWRGFIHRAFSSHAIQVLSAGRAKISNFEYMVESKDNKKCDGIIRFPIPKQLYCWSSPEIVAGRTGTLKSDLYSFCAVIQESLTDSLPWNGLDGETVKRAMASGHYLSVDPALSEPFYSIISTGIQARPEKRTTPLQDIGYLLKNDIKHSLDKLPCPKHAAVTMEAERDMKVQHAEQDAPSDAFEETTDVLYKGSTISSSNSGTVVSSSESLPAICHLEKQADEMNARPGQNKGGESCLQNLGSLSISLSLISDSETGTSSDPEEEEVYGRTPAPKESWHGELRALNDRLASIQRYNKSTLDNLMHIHTVLRENQAGLNSKEYPTESQNVCGQENEFCHKGTDETDRGLPLFESKSYVGWSAQGPPLFYVPPECPSYSRTDVMSDTWKMQNKSVGDTAKKAPKKKEWCAGIGSFTGKTLGKSSAGQDFLQLTKRSSKHHQADDDCTVRHRNYASVNSVPQLPTKKLERGMLSSLLKAESLRKKKPCELICDSDEDEQNKQEQKSNTACCEDSEETKLEKLFRYFSGRKYQIIENEDCNEVLPVGMKSCQDDSEDTDRSNLSTETSYFTTETDDFFEKTEQETLNVCGGSSSITCFDKTLLTGESTTEKKLLGLTTFGLSMNTRSLINVDELSSISIDQKNTPLQCTTPGNSETSARHSTPISPGKLMPGATSKRRFFLEKQLKSPNTANERSIASPSSNRNVSSKTSECFVSAMCHSSDFISSCQEETSLTKDENVNITSVKNQESGSDENALPAPQGSLNKTDRQSRSMEITCLINDTDCDHSESG
ncbi:inactive serine/threonine-protein kinase TEX14 [Ranitomeya variabilis]|uniref:inactive serine/threonine-protein kinase TEX14 n=1 Tax=Ranitomeya variabilis TaxID=490064 RepID=UPI0040566710